ncbi:hypothetical protein [Corynebacterium sp. HMSC074A01]|uniref:hypothetical protein n=1 Tax=Corynebacterium sp. HMSC074A01 TaxID=1715030 RepID=UPI0008A5A635|nr:hypothetical protein [Corynebacterium sp. HMSC074A01]OHF37188.1 hypothetical protein HMPREF2550_04880 [Corynebacterium sp. HMSC074A01]
MENYDPTRIPKLIDALQRVWEGQPDLSLSALLGTLRNRGAGWGTSDEEMLEILNAMEAEHPSLVRWPAETPMTVQTTAPEQRVTLSGSDVVVRPVGEDARMPSAWKATHFRAVGPGRSLIVTDSEGIEHRLGVVTLVHALDPDEVPPLEGLEQPDVGGARWFVGFEDGARAIVGKRITLWRSEGRRATSQESYKFARVLSCEQGAEMYIAPAGGGEPISLGRVAHVVLVDL